MVKERRYLFEAADIRSIIYECLHCGKELSYSLSTNDQPEEACPGCSRPLLNLTVSMPSTLSWRLSVSSPLRRRGWGMIWRQMSTANVRVRFVVPKENR